MGSIYEALQRNNNLQPVVDTLLTIKKQNNTDADKQKLIDLNNKLQGVIGGYGDSGQVNPLQNPNVSLADTVNNEQTQGINPIQNPKQPITQAINPLQPNAPLSADNILAGRVNNAALPMQTPLVGGYMMTNPLQGQTPEAVDNSVNKTAINPLRPNENIAPLTLKPQGNADVNQTPVVDYTKKKSVLEGELVNYINQVSSLDYLTPEQKDGAIKTAQLLVQNATESPYQLVNVKQGEDVLQYDKNTGKFNPVYQNKVLPKLEKPIDYYLGKDKNGISLYGHVDDVHGVNLPGLKDSHLPDVNGKYVVVGRENETKSLSGGGGGGGRGGGNKDDGHKDVDVSSEEAEMNVLFDQYKNAYNHRLNNGHYLIDGKEVTKDAIGGVRDDIGSKMRSKMGVIAQKLKLQKTIDDINTAAKGNNPTQDEIQNLINASGNGFTDQQKKYLKLYYIIHGA